MQYIPTKTGFPFQRQVLSSVKDGIPFPLCGRAPKGFWNQKLEFGTELVRIHPPHAMREERDTLPPPEARIPHEGVLALKYRERSTCRRAFNFAKVPSFSFPQPLFWGENVALSLLKGQSDPDLIFRHADCDTLMFVHDGSGRIETDFGLLYFGCGDFVFLPRGSTYAVDSYKEAIILVYEFASRLMKPKHYWIGGFPFVDTALIPAEPHGMVSADSILRNEKEYSIYLRRHNGRWAILKSPFSPFDALAWEGEIYPFRLRLEDIRTLSSPHFHLDPSALTVLVTEDESVSLQVFLPRWLHSPPYPHQNYCTEILFNQRGYHARPALQDGSATYHPPGAVHGPDLGVLEEMRQKPPLHPREFPWRDEVAVMLESKEPLAILHAAEKVEIAGYESSWYRQYQDMRSTPSVE